MLYNRAPDLSLRSSFLSRPQWSWWMPRDGGCRSHREIAGSPSSVSRSPLEGRRHTLRLSTPKVWLECSVCSHFPVLKPVWLPPWHHSGLGGELQGARYNSACGFSWVSSVRVWRCTLTRRSRPFPCGIGCSFVFYNCLALWPASRQSCRSHRVPPGCGRNGSSYRTCSAQSRTYSCTWSSWVVCLRSFPATKLSSSPSFSPEYLMVWSGYYYNSGR